MPEAVLASKYSFRYIDRVLFDWERNRIRTRQELEAYRQSYRERTKARDEVAAGAASAGRRQRPATNVDGTRDERYAAFYHLFPDA